MAIRFSYRPLLRISLWVFFTLLALPAFSQVDQDSLSEIRFDDTVAPAVDMEDVYEEETDTSTYTPAPRKDTIVYRAVPDSLATTLKSQKEFAYANDPEYWIKEKKKESRGFGDLLDWMFMSTAVRFIVYFVLAFILLYAAYRIAVNNNLFYNPARKKALEEEKPLETVDPGQMDALIAAAVAEKDFRKSIRFYYIKTLFELDRKGWIRYHPEGTNNEYILQIGTGAIAGEFSYLTQVYEYVWYGGFPVSESQFATVQQQFQEFLKKNIR